MHHDNWVLSYIIGSNLCTFSLWATEQWVLQNLVKKELSSRYTWLRHPQDMDRIYMARLFTRFLSLKWIKILAQFVNYSMDSFKHWRRDPLRQDDVLKVYKKIVHEEDIKLLLDMIILKDIKLCTVISVQIVSLVNLTRHGKGCSFAVFSLQLLYQNIIFFLPLINSKQSQEQLLKGIKKRSKKSNSNNRKNQNNSNNNKHHKKAIPISVGKDRHDGLKDTNNSKIYS